MKAAILLFATSAFAVDSTRTNLIFDQWTREHGKKYATQAEVETRRANFVANVEEIARLNKAGTATFKLNKYADESAAERKSRLGFIVPSASQLHAMGPRVYAPAGAKPAAAVDWRAKGVVAPIQDQGQCGSCWAFSAISNVESRVALKNKANITKLSEQQLVDCDQTCGQYRDFNGCDSGCNGGLQPNAWTYMATTAMKTEAQYPYTAEDGTCSASGRSNGAIVGFDMLAQNEDEIMKIVAEQGPVAIAVDASSWSFYSGGIMTDVCSSTSFYDLNHAVNVVGYDTSADGVDFWIVRNSWGEDWGESGYLRIIRNKNQCGFNFFACTVKLNPN